MYLGTWHVTVHSEVCRGSLGDRQSEVVRIVWALSDDVAVVGHGLNDLVTNPPDGDVDTVPDGHPEPLVLTLVEP